MTTPLHDDEPDISAEVVETLLRRQVPQLAGLPLTALSNAGSDNALYRLGGDFHSTTGCTGGSTKPTGWSTHERYFGCGTVPQRR